MKSILHLAIVLSLLTIAPTTAFCQFNNDQPSTITQDLTYSEPAPMDPSTDPSNSFITTTPTNPPPVDDTPIDDWVYVLIAAGMGYGILRFHRNKQRYAVSSL